MTISSARNETVDALRGLAALSVCVFHFSPKEGPFASISSLPTWTVYGRYGVDVFFVISGFVIPLAMARANYSLSVWHRFMARRLIRLEPPYLVSIVIVIGIAALASKSPWFKGPTPEFAPLSIATHLGYLNAYLGTPWLNPVYWSLAIEFQFYVLIGLLLPAFIGGTQTTRLVLVAALAATPSVLPVGGWFITFYLPVFSAGILTFLLIEKLITPPRYWAALATLASYLLFVSRTPASLTTLVVVIFTAIFIAHVRLPHIRAFTWLGAISYSLYLLHVPIGSRVINIIARFGITPAVEIIAIVLSLAASLVAAYIVYRLVERPSQEAAKLISYRNDYVSIRDAKANSARSGY